MNSKSVFWIFALLVLAQLMALKSVRAETIHCRILQTTSDLAYEQVLASRSVELTEGKSESILDSSTRIAATITSSEKGRYTIALYHPSQEGLEPISVAFASTIQPTTLNNQQKQVSVQCSKGT